MKLRKFGKLSFEASVLGFGTMRLPLKGAVPGGNKVSNEVDEKEAIRIIRLAIDHGINYIDTAYGYHEGNSEIIVGQALKDGYRSKVMLATKSPVWLIKEAEDFDKLLNEQLNKLDTDHIDFYLFHSLSRNSWRNTVLRYDLLRRAEAAKNDGKIRHIGFSFHDDADAFIEIIDGYDKWDFCQIQYNYLDIENQAGIKGLKYAASKGLGVVIMEPLLGGKLANPPKDIRNILDENGKYCSPSEWAFEWLWNQPEVSVVLSGMSNMQQVEENLASTDKSGISQFSATDHETIERVRRRYAERTAIPCTACRYCMPCPNNVDIPGNFALYNNSVIHEDVAGSRRSYNNFMAAEKRASECVQCRVCEDKCPQKILISEWMPKVHDAFSV